MMKKIKKFCLACLCGVLLVTQVIPTKQVQAASTNDDEFQMFLADVLVDNYDTKNIVSHFGFAPFFRYTVFSFNNLKIFADAEIPVSFATQKSIIEGNNTTLEVDEPKQFNIGLLIVPGLMYEITEHLSFVSELGLLNLGWIHQRIKVTEEIAPQTTMSYTQKNNQLGFGINNHVQATIGFIYTF